MFNPDFFPTPYDVIQTMLEGTEIADKVILEPSAGKGDIVDYLNDNLAREVLICETNEDLAKIAGTKGKFLKSDFLTVESSDISHIDLMVMNPPFTADERHIIHAFNIAPAGCKIISLANANTINNAYTASRKELKQLIELYGNYESLGDCFSDAERRTGAEIALIKLTKPGASYSQEFEGFFMEEEEEEQANGLISYNVVRDLVNRYVQSIKIFDDQLAAAVKMNQVTSGYFSVDMGMNITDNKQPTTRAEFKKAMQKSGWKFIFNKLNMAKYATQGLREDINKFVEQQTEVPFTMRNIYKMIEIVIGTTGQRMDKAILEVFDKVTQHYHENRFNVEGWKTNSHYLLNRRFIMPGVCEYESYGYKYDNVNPSMYWNNFEKIEDLTKAICYITGENYDTIGDLRTFLRENKQDWGQWFEWGYLKCRAYKKGTMHFEFKDPELWAKFNQKVAELKGFPLYEKAPDKRTEKQKAKAAKPAANATEKKQPVILGTFKLKTV